MENNQKETLKKLKKLRPKKENPATEKLLDNAHSYEEKLAVVRVVTSTSIPKVVLTIRGLLKQDQNIAEEKSKEIAKKEAEQNKQKSYKKPEPPKKKGIAGLFGKK